MANKTDRKSTGRNKGTRNKITQVGFARFKGNCNFHPPATYIKSIFFHRQNFLRNGQEF